MSAISERIKTALFLALIRERNVFINNSPDAVIAFADEIYNLRSIPSEDSRFSDAYLDAEQHMINNQDWTWEFFFVKRLRITEDDTRFIKFLEAIVSPTYRENEDDILRYVFLINPFLESSGLELALNSHHDQTDLPIYRIRERHAHNSPPDIKPNRIPIFIYKTVYSKSNRPSSHSRPPQAPALVLVFNHKWNDYSIMTTFELFYYNQDGHCHGIGELKMAVDPTIDLVNMQATILEHLQDKYEANLPETVCSLGQTERYYKSLKNLLGKQLESVLFALRDVAFFTDIREKFQSTTSFRAAVIRESASERIMRQIKLKIYGYDMNNLYKFTYNFHPSYAEDGTDVNFEFSNDGAVPNRIYALIGKNGTGKTQFITSLPSDIWKQNHTKFIPKTPMFSKVIAVSYSAFDKFQIPQKTSLFNYVYCGLKKPSGKMMTDAEQLERFSATVQQIVASKRVDQWYKVLTNFIDERILHDLFTPHKEILNRNSYIVNVSKMSTFRSGLSSGQNIMFYIISEIVANIMFDSLLLFDEPETHLHPNAITEVVNTIYQLVNEFQSYCIIATHSPLVIRELFSKNVFVVERNENIPSVKRIGIESFGENLTTLTEEVFGNKDIPKQYKLILEQFVNEGKTYEEIIELLQFDNIPLSLNARIYIKSLINNERA